MSALNDDDRENLGAFLDGELDEETTRALEGKLIVDPEARRELDALKNIHGLLDYLPQPQPSPNFTNRTLEKLSLAQPSASSRRAASRPRSVLKWLAWSAAVLLAATVGYASQRVLYKPSPQEEISDETLVRYLRTVENWRNFDRVDSVDFLRALDNPELFGGDGKS